MSGSVRDNKMDYLPEDPNKDKIINILSIVSSAVPYLGGPVSALLSGYVTKRKFERMTGVIKSLAEDLKEFKNEASEKYVSTDDFEDLFDDTLRKVAFERNEEKRKLFKNLLLRSIKECDSDYDELHRILRIIEQMQPDHVILLKALDQTPRAVSGFTGSPMQTLQERIPQFHGDHIKELVDQLNNLRVINLTSLNVMMTPSGAQELRGSITSLGQRIMRYIKETP